MYLLLFIYVCLCVCVCNGGVLIYEKNNHWLENGYNEKILNFVKKRTKCSKYDDFFFVVYLLSRLFIWF